MTRTLETGSKSRLAVLDNLRTGLIVLVVLHHVAMAYGAAGLGFYYVELHPDGFSRGLLIFVLSNQAWFMGGFFLVAGYLTPASLDRKGARRFLSGRLIRLGIPLAVYVLLLNPLSTLGWFFVADPFGPMTWETFNYADSVRMGPMWFVALLLIFSFGYTIGRTLVRRPGRESPAPGATTVAAFVLALAGVTILMRLWIPVGEEWYGFPSLGYLPQYLSFFSVGVIAYRRDWLTNVRPGVGWAGLGMAALATILLFPYAFSGEVFSIELTNAIGNAFGDSWHWQGGAYALWDSTLAVGLVLFLLTLGRSFLGSQSSVSRFLAGNTYGVYVLHIPIVVYIAVAMRNIEMDHILKFGLAAVIAVPVCFAAAAIVRRIPGVSKVL